MLQVDQAWQMNSVLLSKFCAQMVWYFSNSSIGSCLLLFYVLQIMSICCYYACKLINYILLCHSDQ